MSKKESQPVDDEARLKAAVDRVAEEVELFKHWMASDARKPPAGSKPSDGGSRVPVPRPNRGPATVTAPAADGRIVDLLERMLSQLKWGGIVGIIAVVIAALGLALNSWRNTQTVVQQIQLNNLEITAPPDGASVGLGQIVRGNTPYSSLNHYLAVTLVRTGSVSIQPAQLNPDGTFSGEVKFTDPFGNSAAGEDDEFTVRVFATQEQLSAGNITSFPDDAKVSRQITVRRTKPTQQFAITVPAPGASVGLQDQVSGSTPFVGLNHYVIVTALRVGTRYVQDQPATVVNGTFNGRAVFGGANVGVGEQFSIQILATKSTLAAGPLVKPPDDAVLSNSINVTRK